MDETVKKQVAHKYQSLELVGEDWFGTAYKAKKVANGRPVLLRVMHTALAKKTAYVKRVNEMLRTAVTMAHPNLMRIIAADVAGEGNIFFASELPKGETLQNRLKRDEKVSVEQSIAITLQILSALNALDRRGLTHGYLQPAAVYLIEESGRTTVKLSDYGLLDLQEFIGDPRLVSNYLSAEQALGEGRIDLRSDIFSAGLVLFELLTGRRVYESDGKKDVAMSIIVNAPPAIDTVMKGLPGGLQRAIDAALAHDCDDRVKDIKTLVGELAPYCAVRDKYLSRPAARHIEYLLPKVKRSKVTSTPKKPVPKSTPKPIEPKKGLVLPKKPPMAKPIVVASGKGAFGASPPDPTPRGLADAPIKAAGSSAPKTGEPIAATPEVNSAKRLFPRGDIETHEIDIPTIDDGVRSPPKALDPAPRPGKVPPPPPDEIQAASPPAPPPSIPVSQEAEKPTFNYWSVASTRVLIRSRQIYERARLILSHLRKVVQNRFGSLNFGHLRFGHLKTRRNQIIAGSILVFLLLLVAGFVLLSDPDGPKETLDSNGSDASTLTLSKPDLTESPPSESSESAVRSEDKPKKGDRKKTGTNPAASGPGAQPPEPVVAPLEEAESDPEILEFTPKTKKPKNRKKRWKGRAKNRQEPETNPDEQIDVGNLATNPFAAP